MVYFYGAVYLLVFLHAPNVTTDNGYTDKVISLLFFSTLPSMYVGAAVLLAVAFAIWRRCSSRVATLVGIICVLGMAAGFAFQITAVVALSLSFHKVTTWENALVVGSFLAIALAGVALAFAAIAYGPASIAKGLQSGAAGPK